jgi:hypothetical protein
MAYITARLTGRPLYALVWLIWLSIVVMLVGVQCFNIGGDFRSQALILILIGAAGLVLYMGGLIEALTRRTGRTWLMSVCHDEKDERIHPSSRLIVWLVPLLGLFFISEYWFFR